MFKTGLSSFFLPKLRLAHSPSGQQIASPSLPKEVVAGSIFANILGLAMPLAILQVYDRVLPNASTDTLLVLILCVVAVLIADALIKIARVAVVSRMGAGFNHQAHLELFRRVLDADPDRFSATPVSVQVHQLRALQSVSDHYGDQSRLLAIDLPASGIFLAVLVFIGGPLALVPVFLLGLFMLFALKRNKVLQKVVSDRADHDDRKSDFVLEVLSGAKTVKALAMEALMMRRFERLQKTTARLSARYMKLSSDARDGSSLFGTLTTVCVVLVGAGMVIQGQFSIGGVAAATLLSGQFIQPFLRAINQWTDMERLKHDFQQVNTLFELPALEEKAPFHDDIDGSISLVNVSLRREGQTEPVFDNINLNVRAGQFIAFKGADGSGKSTLMKLLTGEVAPTDGQVLIGGIDYAGPHHHALRRSVAYVDSQAAVFNGTILENITMFGAVSDIAHARMAAQLIGLEKEIHLLPRGYETMLGADLGGKIPTSTLQRVGIARALAGEPRILILDEANASLDQEAERGLFDALQKLKGHLTVVIISHRPSMLAIADKQYELAGGTAHEVPKAGGPAKTAAVGLSA
ncbi:ATP-binding cassette domain-containing protein [Roseibium denhamense]|uniref:ATP-binding cassette, subfamily C, LapB n=1 Tax=Roseibium denhamense TaxID=76305 RepID=A0ABY1PGH2_9HYPH|nr:ABC transporter transmembrane domain-containing protein [Roseibium denhamense]MTI07790.1 ATP-binding cassette domain-containing protein [Roseibium denhamense]SMP32115.1 ATP-binding cassette, subfamily C, LapB [Roseibium denhamense]